MNIWKNSCRSPWSNIPGGISEADLQEIPNRIHEEISERVIQVITEQSIRRMCERNS